MEALTYAVMRTEKKYEIPPVTSFMLANRLSKIMDTDRHGGPCGYTVRSLYFDSIDDSDFFDKVNGLEFRRKIRLRIYSPAQRRVKLELKQKQGTVQVKKTLEISRESAAALIEGNFSSLLTLKGNFPKELYQIMSCGLYRPKCIIAYHRTAFTAQASDTRITIDTDVRASKNCACFFASSPALLPMLHWPVLEVKYNGFLPEQCRQAVNPAGILEMAFSKYEMARRLVY